MSGAGPGPAREPGPRRGGLLSGRLGPQTREPRKSSRPPYLGPVTAPRGRALGACGSGQHNAPHVLPAPQPSDLAVLICRRIRTKAGVCIPSYPTLILRALRVLGRTQPLGERGVGAWAKFMDLARIF